MSAVLETLTERHVRDAFILATKVFVEHSTLHKALGIRLDEYREYLRPSFEAMVNEGLSVVAISEETNEVVGCLIASDFFHHVSGNEIELGKFGPLSALTNALNRHYASKRQIGEREA
ncbi:MAG: hypothetical protein P8Q23_07080, partial [Paracoccaceae bacterium]|nr:hypothetical protein [Paracoccaceae bacterium]